MDRSPWMNIKSNHSRPSPSETQDNHLQRQANPRSGESINVLSFEEGLAPFLLVPHPGCSEIDFRLVDQSGPRPSRPVVISCPSTPSHHRIESPSPELPTYCTDKTNRNPVYEYEDQ